MAMAVRISEQQQKGVRYAEIRILGRAYDGFAPEYTFCRSRMGNPSLREENVFSRNEWVLSEQYQCSGYTTHSIYSQLSEFISRDLWGDEVLPGEECDRH